MSSAGDVAASERLQARSLMLAGQASLCCNPRCWLDPQVFQTLMQPTHLPPSAVALMQM